MRNESESGAVTHIFDAAPDAAWRGTMGDVIRSARCYAIEGSPRRRLVWYETDGIVPAADTAGWTEGAADAERMTFRLVREAGDAAAAALPWLYVVHTDVPDEIAAEYNAWYDAEHLPRLVRVPGIVRARRYVSPDAHPRYLTAYELSDRDAFASPQGLMARKTPWTERMRALFTNTRRFTGRLRDAV